MKRTHYSAISIIIAIILSLTLKVKISPFLVFLLVSETLISVAFILCLISPKINNWFK